MGPFPHSSFGWCLEGQADTFRMDHRKRVMTPTVVTGTWIGLLFAVMAASTSFRLIFPTTLLWFKSLIPSDPPSLLAKNTSSVAGKNIGASWANAKVALCATCRIEGLEPSMDKKERSKIWKNGGAVDVGLKNVSMASSRNVAFPPRTLKDRGSTNYVGRNPNNYD